MYPSESQLQNIVKWAEKVFAPSAITWIDPRG
jgi:hypothetical protein